MLSPSLSSMWKTIDGSSKKALADFSYWIELHRSNYRFELHNGNIEEREIKSGLTIIVNHRLTKVNQMILKRFRFWFLPEDLGKVLSIVTNYFGTFTTQLPLVEVIAKAIVICLLFRFQLKSWVFKRKLKFLTEKWTKDI
jgi:hypothetical protein